MEDCKMKIVHLCISQSYFDGWGYQENLIPAYQADMGHDVCVISTNKFYPHWLKKEEEDKILAKGEIYKDGNIKVRRIKVLRVLGTHVVFTYNLYKTLMKERPDIIFYHEMTNFSTIICAVYKLFHPKVSYFIDSHTDKRNSASTKISEWFYFKGFLTLMHKFIAPFVTYYYGVTPSRCNFLLSHYGVSPRKMKFLPIGCDTKLADTIASKSELREKYQLPSDSFVVVSGGKMGKFKGTECLINAVEQLRGEGHRIELVLFGVYLDEETKCLAESKKWIHTYGWCDRNTTLELLKLADVASWPIHHTTLNEDAIAVGTPLVIRKTTTTEHLVDKNGEFLFSIGDVDELKLAISKIKNNMTNYEVQAKIKAQKMSYYRIGETIIQDAKKSNES